jgi:hypothetical protein
MAQTVLITLTLAGVDVGPFDLYSDADGYTSAFEIGVSRAALVAGYTSSLVPDLATTIKAQSYGTCDNYLYLVIENGTTTTTTTSTSTSTTTSTTTAAPIATFEGFFEFCNDASSTKDFRVQDGSATPGHFATSSTITPNNCAGTITVSGTLNSAQGPLKISVPSLPVGSLATIVANGIGGVGCTVTSNVVGSVLQIWVTPDTYPSTISLSGTLTVTYP